MERRRDVVQQTYKYAYDRSERRPQATASAAGCPPHIHGVGDSRPAVCHTETWRQKELGCSRRISLTAFSIAATSSPAMTKQCWPRRLRVWSSRRSRCAGRRRAATRSIFWQAWTIPAAPFTPPLPTFLTPLRERVAAWAKRRSGRIYDGADQRITLRAAPIGWHRDAPLYGIVAGISLTSRLAG